MNPEALSQAPAELTLSDAGTKVFEALMALTPAERETVLLRADLASPPPLSAAWQAEIARRITEIEAGTAVGRPVMEVMEELRSRYA